MHILPITEKNRKDFNKMVTHPLQSYEWGEFREKTGVQVVRQGFYEKNTLVQAFQLTIHKIPYTPWTIGYLPKGSIPTEEMLRELVALGKKYHCIFIQLEPNVKKERGQEVIRKLLLSSKLLIRNSSHPLFTKYSFQLDLGLSESELLKNMHPKTRYNIRVAQKHDIIVKEETSEEAFTTYLSLTQETTTRQGFYAHSHDYHRHMWETLGNKRHESEGLRAHLFIAYYKPPEEIKPIPLTAWILFVFNDMLYYPYGASSTRYREVMASNLMMWEAIRFGKQQKLIIFDMWGSLGENPNPNDPWYGFHRFKLGYRPKLVEFIGSYDIVITPWIYRCYILANRLRWFFLKLKNRQ